MTQFERLRDLIYHANSVMHMKWDRLYFQIDEDGWAYLVLEEDQNSCYGHYVEKEYQGPFSSFDDLEDFLVEQYTPGDLQIIKI